MIEHRWHLTHVCGWLETPGPQAQFQHLRFHPYNSFKLVDSIFCLIPWNREAVVFNQLCVL